MSNFDKYVCFRNIRELLKDSDFRIGAIEKAAKCQPGYMSRLEKKSNTTNPSMEFIVTASKMFNVPIDLLINDNLNGMNEDEQYLRKFLAKLIEDTKAGYLSWQMETPSFLSFERKGNSYHCYLPQSDVNVYLVNAVERKGKKSESFYDLYIVKNDKDPCEAIPICSSQEIRIALSSEIKMLYSCVEKKYSNVYIDYDVMKILDRYMRKS